MIFEQRLASETKQFHMIAWCISHLVMTICGVKKASLIILDVSLFRLHYVYKKVTSIRVVSYWMEGVCFLVWDFFKCQSSLWQNP